MSDTYDIRKKVVNFLPAGPVLDMLVNRSVRVSNSSLKAAPTDKLALPMVLKASVDEAASLCRVITSPALLEKIASKDKRKTVKLAVSTNKNINEATICLLAKHASAVGDGDIAIRLSKLAEPKLWLYLLMENDFALLQLLRKRKYSHKPVEEIYAEALLATKAFGTIMTSLELCKVDSSPKLSRDFYYHIVRNLSPADFSKNEYDEILLYSLANLEELPKRSLTALQETLITLDLQSLLNIKYYDSCAAAGIIALLVYSSGFFPEYNKDAVLEKVNNLDTNALRVLRDILLEIMRTDKEATSQCALAEILVELNNLNKYDIYDRKCYTPKVWEILTRSKSLEIVVLAISNLPQAIKVNYLQEASSDVLKQVVLTPADLEAYYGKLSDENLAILLSTYVANSRTYYNNPVVFSEHMLDFIAKNMPINQLSSFIFSYEQLQLIKARLLALELFETHFQLFSSLVKKTLQTISIDTLSLTAFSELSQFLYEASGKDALRSAYTARIQAFGANAAFTERMASALAADERLAEVLKEIIVNSVNNNIALPNVFKKPLAELVSFDWSSPSDKMVEVLTEYFLSVFEQNTEKWDIALSLSSSWSGTLKTLVDTLDLL